MSEIIVIKKEKGKITNVLKDYARSKRSQQDIIKKLSEQYRVCDGYEIVINN